MSATGNGPSDTPLSCASCSARLAHDQRYCVECGERRGLLQYGAANMLGTVLEQGRSRPDPLTSAPPAPRLAAAGPLAVAVQAPRAAATAILAMLGFGVVLGSLANANPASLASTVLVSVAPPQPVAPPATLADTGSGSGGGGSGGSTSAATTTTTTTTSQQTTTQQTTTSQTTSSTPGTNALPTIHHVFLIVLSDHGVNESFGPGSQDTYLSKTLPKQGELIANYWAVASSALANEVALISGQGPTLQTAANCPTYTAIAPGAADSSGQILGDGCVYPSAATSFPEQLTDNGNTWKAYIQGISNAPAGQPVSCRHPQLGAADTDQLPRPGDPYVTWRNPFVYFNAIISAPDCAANDVDLDQLATDLQKEKTTPTFSYIAPSPCDDGSVQPCITGGQGGLPPLDAFLQSVVPEIEQSPAYKDNGLIAITFDEAPQTGPSPDTTGYNNPTYPNLATTAPATAMDALFRWASAFAQASDIAGLNLGPTTTTTTSTTSSTSTGSTGTSTSGTGTSSTGTSSSSTGTSSTGTSTSTSTTTTTSTSTTTTDTSTTPITTPITTPTTTPTSTTTTSTTSSSTAPPGSPSPGGGQVGLLLISPTIKPGCNDLVDSFNHYSLLASFETLFGLDKLGYAKDAIPFDASVFNCHH